MTFNAVALLRHQPVGEPGVRVLRTARRQRQRRPVDEAARRGATTAERRPTAARRSRALQATGDGADDGVAQRARRRDESAEQQTAVFDGEMLKALAANEEVKDQIKRLAGGIGLEPTDGEARVQDRPRRGDDRRRPEGHSPGARQQAVGFPFALLVLAVGLVGRRSRFPTTCSPVRAAARAGARRPSSPMSAASSVVLVARR